MADEKVIVISGNKFNSILTVVVAVLVIGLIVGFTIGILWIRQGNKNSKIKRTQNSSIENYPELKEKLKQGWKFSKISKLISDLLK